MSQNFKKKRKNTHFRVFKNVANSKSIILFYSILFCPRAFNKTSKDKCKEMLFVYKSHNQTQSCFIITINSSLDFYPTCFIKKKRKRLSYNLYLAILVHILYFSFIKTSMLSMVVFFFSERVRFVDNIICGRE